MHIPLKPLAAFLLAAALAAIALVHFASQMMVAIQGPGTLRAVGPGTVWLAVNDELWILDLQGRLVAKRPVRDLGLAAAVSNIAPGPDGRVLLTSRRDEVWPVVDARTAAPVKTIAPAWPADLREHATRAIHVAVSPQWTIGVGTGGGHTVALFDESGKFRARSKPGTFHFTNGLWHAPGQGWWTTDTNRSSLHLLDAQTLELRMSLRLPRATPGYTALGELIPSQGRPRPGDTMAPLATVTRLGYLMEPGHAADVFPDGRMVLYNPLPLAQLRDLTWFNGELLVVDGGTFEILRFAPDRTALPPFGDAAVRAAFAQMRSDRQFWASISSRWGLGVAALLLVAGIAVYVRHQQLAGRVASQADAAPARPWDPLLASLARGPHSRWQQAAASFVVPGSGQWMQGRFLAGTVLFTVAFLVCILVWGPVLWASTGPKMHVGLQVKLGAFAVWLLVSVASAIDASRFRSNS